MEELIRKIETVDASGVEMFVLTLNENLTNHEKEQFYAKWEMTFRGTKMDDIPVIILGEGESLQAVRHQMTNEIRESEASEMGNAHALRMLGFPGPISEMWVPVHPVAQDWLAMDRKELATAQATTYRIENSKPLPGWEDAVWKQVLDAVLCTCFTYGDSDCPVHGKPTEAEHPTAECTCESLLGLRNCPACKAKRGESNG